MKLSIFNLNRVLQALAQLCALAWAPLFGLVTPTHAFQLATPFNTTTAPTQMGALERGPNTNYCGNIAGLSGGNEPFKFINSNPIEGHHYQVYDVYNPGGASCREITLSWINGDCGDLELGFFVYRGSFNPSNITENLLGAGFQDDRGQPTIGVSTSNLSEYRYSPGYDRHGGFLGTDYYTDWLFLKLNVPAYAHLKVVVVAKRLASAPPASCATPILYSSDLSLTPTSFKISDTQRSEFNPPGGATLDFVVGLESVTNSPVSVNWTTADGLGVNGGVAGIDYTAANGTVTFQPGEDSKVVSVPIISNLAIQPNRTVRVILSNPSPNAIAISDNTGVGTIIDDDTPTCRFSAPNVVPNGTVGAFYGPLDFIPTGADNINDYTITVANGSLPPGLGFQLINPAGNINAFGRIAGTPTTPGTYNFTLSLVCPLMEGGTDTYSQSYTIIVDNGLPKVLVTLPNVAALEGNAGLTPVAMTV